MNAVERMFPQAPNLLCTWHINKNVVAKCKKYFKTGNEWADFMQTWDRLCRSPTEQDYNAAVVELNAKCPPRVIQYLTSTWLDVTQDSGASIDAGDVFAAANIMIPGDSIPTEYAFNPVEISDSISQDSDFDLSETAAECVPPASLQ